MKIDDIQIEAVAKNNLFAMSIYAFGLSFDSETRQFVDGKVEKIA